MSQPELGRRARVGPKFISQIERGIGNPSLLTMALMADALDCDLVDLLPSDRSVSRYTLVLADDIRRAREAASVVAEALTPKRRRRS